MFRQNKTIKHGYMTHVSGSILTGLRRKKKEKKKAVPTRRTSPDHCFESTVKPLNDGKSRDTRDRASAREALDGPNVKTQEYNKER